MLSALKGRSPPNWIDVNYWLPTRYVPCALLPFLICYSIDFFKCISWLANPTAMKKVLFYDRKKVQLKFLTRNSFLLLLDMAKSRWNLIKMYRTVERLQNRTDFNERIRTIGSLLCEYWTLCNRGKIFFEKKKHLMTLEIFSIPLTPKHFVVQENLLPAESAKCHQKVLQLQMITTFWHYLERELQRNWVSLMTHCSVLTRKEDNETFVKSEVNAEADKIDSEDWGSLDEISTAAYLLPFWPTFEFSISSSSLKSSFKANKLFKLGENWSQTKHQKINQFSTVLSITNAQNHKWYITAYN